MEMFLKGGENNEIKTKSNKKSSTKKANNYKKDWENSS